MTDSEQVIRLFDQTERSLGAINILVNSTGTAEFGSLAEITNEAFNQQMTAVLISESRLAHYVTWRKIDGYH